MASVGDKRVCVNSEDQLIFEILSRKWQWHVIAKIDKEKKI